MVVDLTGTAFKVEVVFVDETATVDADETGGFAGPTGIGADGFIWEVIAGFLTLTKDFVIDGVVLPSEAGVDVTGSIESAFLLEFEAVVKDGEDLGDFIEGVVVTDLVGTGLFEAVLLAAVTGLIVSL